MPRAPWIAGLVHLFTALGVVCALMAALAVIDRAYERMFLWLGLAFFIDGIDGTFARAARVKEVLPRFSGEQLDLVDDYVTYVFVPVLAMLQAGFLPGTWGLVLAALALLSSLFHFSDLESKSEDLSFVGFPAVWNIVAFYVFAFAMAPLAAGLLVLACVALTFVPLRWVHPLRVKRLRGVTLALSVAWSLAALWTVLKGFPAGRVDGAVLIAVAVYGLLLTFVRPLPPRAP